MRFSARKLRKFRPETLVLEGLCPVSVLPFAMGASPDQPIAETDSVSVEVSSSTTPQWVTSELVAGHLADDVNAGFVGEPEQTPEVAGQRPPVVQQVSSQTTAEDAGSPSQAAANLLDTEDTAPPQARTAEDPGASSAPAPSADPRPVNTTVGDQAASDSDGIRPMTMTSPGQKPDGMILPMTSSGGSGGGTPPAPNILVSGGGSAGSGGTGHLTITGGVPVGTKLSCSVTPPTGFTIQPGSIIWSGMTDYKDYLANAPTDVAPQTMAVTTGVATNTATTGFIVDGAARPYDVSVSVIYNEAPGVRVSSDVAFTSIAPAYATIAAANMGTANHSILPNGNILIQLDDLANSPNFPGNQGIEIAMSTQTSAFGGTFMILQLMHVQRTMTVVDAAGDSTSFFMPNAGSGLNLDNFGLTGFYTDPANANDTSTRSWHMDANAASVGHHVTYDTPWVRTPPTMFGGDVTAFAVGANSPESFFDYLMYKPDNVSGVWVPLSKFTWQWGVSGTKNPQGTWNWSGANATSTASAGVSSTDWPSWTGRIQQDVLGRVDPITQGPWISTPG